MKDTISSLGGFAFVLLLISIGYIFVESWGKHYPWSNSMDKYKSENVFERGIHYLTWGIIVNLRWIITLGQIPFIITRGLQKFSIISTLIDQLGKDYSFDILSVKLFIFVIIQFTVLVIRSLGRGKFFYRLYDRKDKKQSIKK